MSILRAVALLTMAILTIGCSPDALLSMLPSSTGPLLTLTTRGGHCLDGPCGSTVVIDRDGTLRQTAPEDAVLGTVPPEALSALASAVAATDYAAVRARPFTGECPVNFDGQETVYEFGTPHGVERVASCETEIDPNQPVFLAVQQALAAGGAV